jgi:hypothetical protein
MAAMPTLHAGDEVRVTWIDTGATLDVQINEDGPRVLAEVVAESNGNVVVELRGEC